MADDIVLLAARISELMDGNTSNSSESMLAEMEHTLTDGYAQVLALEGERWRIERRIADLARDLDADGTGELRDLASRLLRAETDVGRLRRLLESPRLRADALRAETAAAALKTA